MEGDRREIETERQRLKETELHAEISESESEVAQCARLFATPWTVAYQAPPSMGFSRQEYWSGLPFPSPGDLPHPGIKPGSPSLQADALPSEPPGNKKQSELSGYLCMSAFYVSSYLFIYQESDMPEQLQSFICLSVVYLQSVIYRCLSI